MRSLTLQCKLVTPLLLAHAIGMHRLTLLLLPELLHNKRLQMSTRQRRRLQLEKQPHVVPHLQRRKLSMQARQLPGQWIMALVWIALVEPVQRRASISRLVRRRRQVWRQKMPDKIRGWLLR